MVTKQDIFDWLDGQRGRWPSIAEEAGINYWWILKFMAGGIKNPGHDKITSLSILMQKERRKRRTKASSTKDSSSDRLQP